MRDNLLNGASWGDGLLESGSKTIYKGSFVVVWRKKRRMKATAQNNIYRDFTEINDRDTLEKIETIILKKINKIT